MRSKDIQEIEKRFGPLVGMRPWRAELGHGSFVTLELGEPIETKGGHVHGAWHLWVYCCAWRLDEGDRMLAGSEDERQKLAEKIRTLEGRALVGFSARPPAGQAELLFEGDLRLTLFPLGTELEHYMLFMPNGLVLTVGPGDTWSEESASADRDPQPSH